MIIYRSSPLSNLFTIYWRTLAETRAISLSILVNDWLRVDRLSSRGMNREKGIYWWVLWGIRLNRELRVRRVKELADE
jgi:hypothetical protein